MLGIIYKPLLYCYILMGMLPHDKMAKTAFHPLHISTTDVNYNAKEGKLEVICTIFTDDFESALTKEYHTPVDLLKESAKPTAEALVSKYIASHVLLKPNQAPVNLTYLGYEVKDAALIVYLESDKVPAVKRMDVDISLLHNLYQDQINIVHITVNGIRKSEKLDYPNRKLTQVF